MGLIFSFFTVVDEELAIIPGWIRFGLVSYLCDACL